MTPIDEIRDEPPPPERAIRRRIVALIGVPVVSLGIFALWTLESFTEVDTNTGRLRASTSVLGIVLRGEVRETDFSKLVIEPAKAVPAPRWRRAYDHKPGLGRHLLFGRTWHYYRSGRVAADMKAFCLWCDLHEFPPDVRTQTARELIAFLRRDDLDGFDERYSQFEAALPELSR
jgi:hypothetical protein